MRTTLMIDVDSHTTGVDFAEHDLLQLVVQ